MIRFAPALFVYLGLLAGCGEDPPAPAGMRLVGWRLEPGSAGSTPLWLGVYDQELATVCRFVNASDDNLRCLPFAPRAKPLGDLFADAACQQPLFTWTQLQVGQPETAPKVLTVDTGRPCAPSFEARQAQPFGAGPVYERALDGTCARRPDPLPAAGTGEVMLVARTPIPASRFAEGRRVRLPPPSGQRIGVEQIESAAGGPFPFALHDTRWDRTCSVDVDDAAVTCWPPHAVTTAGRFAFYTDDSCATPVAVDMSDDERCAEPVLIRGRDQVHTLGPRWTGQVQASYRLSDDSCAPTNDGPRPVRSYAIGPALPTDAISRLQRQPTGTGPLRLRVPTSVDGRALELPLDPLHRFGLPTWFGTKVAEFQDDQHARTCTPFRAADGTIRCLPVDELVRFDEIYFADAACTQPLAACTACDGKDLLLLADDDPLVPQATAVKKLGAPFSGAAFTTGHSNDHLCRPLDPSFIAPGSLRTIGATIPWDQYPKLVERRGTERLGP